MPFQSARLEVRERGGRGCSACLPQPEPCPLSKLHYLSPEGARKLRRQEPAAMKKLLLTFIFTSLAAAQQPTAAAPEVAKPAETNPADAASPVPTGEEWISGFIDLGYRWRTDV